MALVALALVAVPAGSAAASGAPAASVWDVAQQRQVVGAGLMQEDASSFDGAGELSAAQANQAMVVLASRLQQAASEAGVLGEQAAPGATPLPGAPVAATTASLPVAQTAQSPVTVVSFDRMLVEELGLIGVAEHVQEVATAAGLHPPAYFGSEVVARLLELRYEHPVGSQRLDLFPEQPITRAEAAWSLARVMGLSEWNISGARETLSTFALPQLSAAQRQPLQIALSRIGYPYVWGGTTDNTADGLEHGGYDCSGFAWRVYKLSGLPWGRQIRGRTAAEQAGEIPKRERIHLHDVAGGDLLFFGSAHFNSTATESNVIHEAIAMSSEWAINSSGQGVYVLPLTSGWLAESFTWARRVL